MSTTKSSPTSTAPAIRVQLVIHAFPFQSAESKDLHKLNKSLKVKSNESLAETPRSSEDDFDSAFTENGENGKETFAGASRLSLELTLI